MLEKAAGICDVTYGNIYRWDNGVFQLVATHNTPRAFVEARRLFAASSQFEKSLWAHRRDQNGPSTSPTSLPNSKSIFEAGNPDQLAAVELGGVKTITDRPAAEGE